MNADFAPIIVRKHAEGGWEVIQSGTTTDKLCLGEMIEMVLKLSEPGTPGPRYGMTPIESQPDPIELAFQCDALLRVARDFHEVLEERCLFCECGEPDCRTTRLRAALKAAGVDL
jgi:hypothetical protein